MMNASFNNHSFILSQSLFRGIYLSVQTIEIVFLISNLTVKALQFVLEDPAFLQRIVATSVERILRFLGFLTKRFHANAQIPLVLAKTFDPALVVHRLEFRLRSLLENHFGVVLGDVGRVRLLFVLEPLVAVLEGPDVAHEFREVGGEARRVAGDAEEERVVDEDAQGGLLLDELAAVGGLGELELELEEVEGELVAEAVPGDGLVGTNVGVLVGVVGRIIVIVLMIVLLLLLLLLILCKRITTGRR